MNEKKYIINSKNPNIDPIILNIMNEAIQEFSNKYGDKHLPRIKDRIENITDKVQKAIMYYNAPIASAHHEKGVIYTDSDKLSSVLKHELWHVYNNSTVDLDISLQYTPPKYKDVLKNSGYLEELYNQTMNEYKEMFKEEPDRLKFILTDYDTFVDKYGFGAHEVEKWTEWFNTKTHDKDMDVHYWDFDDGFFTKQISSGSFYDSYRSIPEMISTLIPIDKLIDMYMQTSDYKTDYSYPEMIEEFDAKYSDSLDDVEKEKYKFPYLKLIMDTKIIDENARTNPKIAREALQSSMKTIFNAYLIKLENIENLDLEQAKEIYSQIKNMQNHMIWNTDISKMQDLDYVDAMNRIQDKFKNMLQEMDLNNSDVQMMFDKIDYKTNNQYTQIENGKIISEKMVSTRNINGSNITTIGDYTTNVNNNGIKDNLYASLFTVLENEKFNLLFEETQKENSFDEKENILYKMHKQIEGAKSEEEIMKVYDDIYNLFAKKIDNNLNLNQSIDILFSRYSGHIIELQKNALFNKKTHKYMPSLENVINIFREKTKGFELVVDETTAKKLEKELAREGSNIEAERNWHEKFSGSFKQELQTNVDKIDIQRKEQCNQYKELKEDVINNDTIDEMQIGKDILLISTKLEENFKKVSSNKKINDLLEVKSEVSTRIKEIENPSKAKSSQHKEDEGQNLED